MSSTFLFFFILYAAVSVCEEIGGKGVKLDRLRGVLTKTVSRKEATTDFMGDYLMYHLLADPVLECGDYGYLNLESITVKKATSLLSSANTAVFSRQLFPGKSILQYRSQPIKDLALMLLGKTPQMPDGWDVPVQPAGETFKFTEKNLRQFALISLFDQIVLNSDRFKLGLGTMMTPDSFNAGNIMWHKSGHASDEITLLPIDNGWGALILIIQHHAESWWRMGPKLTAEDVKKAIQNPINNKFRWWVNQVADDKKVEGRARTLWHWNKELFKSMDMSEWSDDAKAVRKIVEYWKKHRAYIAEKIESMMQEQFKNKIQPLFEGGDCKEACLEDKESVEWMNREIEKNVAVFKKDGESKISSARTRAMPMQRLQSMLDLLDELEDGRAMNEGWRGQQ